MTDQTHTTARWTDKGRRYIRVLLDRPTENCPVGLPLWRSWPVLTFVPGIAVIVIAQVWGLPIIGHHLISATIAGLIAGTLIDSATGRLFRTQHAHCDACQTCSSVVGVPIARSRKAAERALDAAGWLLADGETYCTACRVRQGSGWSA